MSDSDDKRSAALATIDELRRSTSIAAIEKVDAIFILVDVHAWYAKIGLYLIVGLVLLWLFFGQVPIYVSGRGILLNPGGIKTVYANSQGQITSLDVKVGDTLVKGQVYGSITRENLRGQIQLLYEQIEEKKLMQLQSGELRELEIQFQERKLSNLEQRKESLKKLLEAGLITESNYIEIEDQISEIENAIEKIQFQYIQEKHDIKNQERQLRGQIAQYNLETKLISPYDGIVVEIKDSDGANVNASTPLLTVEINEAKDELVGMIFVNAADAKIVEPGMPMTISPDFINTEQYGSIMGTVEMVSAYPISREALKNRLQYDSIVEDISEEGIKVESKAKLVKDSSTVSGLKWTSIVGPPIKIKSGTLCTVQIRVANKRPIEYIFPKIKVLMDKHFQKKD